MNRLLITLFLVMLITTGCSHYVVNKAGYIRPPENFKFGYRNKAAKLKNCEVIDTNTIYYMNDNDVYRNSSEYKHEDQYIRFYANGKCKIQATKTYPKIEDINNIERGIVGYYKLNGRVLKIEMYGDIGGGTTHAEFGLVNDNNDVVLLYENPSTNFGIGYSLKGIERKIRKSSFFNPKVYKKIKLDGLTFDQPNW